MARTIGGMPADAWTVAKLIAAYGCALEMADHWRALVEEGVLDDVEPFGSASKATFLVELVDELQAALQARQITVEVTRAQGSGAVMVKVPR